MWQDHLLPELHHCSNAWHQMLLSSNLETSSEQSQELSRQLSVVDVNHSMSEERNACVRPVTWCSLQMWILTWSMSTLFSIRYTRRSLTWTKYWPCCIKQCPFELFYWTDYVGDLFDCNLIFLSFMFLFMFMLFSIIIFFHVVFFFSFCFYYFMF